MLPFVAVLRWFPRKPDLRQAPLRGGRLVSIVVPARNESGNIRTLLTSLLQSRYEPCEIIVVDDRSTDDTVEIVEELIRGSDRIRLVRGAELPPGWYGKPWACHQGYRLARGELLAFTDADTRHAPDLLGHAVGALEQERADLVSIIPRQRFRTFWERVIMPQIGVLFMLRYSPRTVNRARHARDVIANGQFILVSRSGYERVGTHERVRDQVVEDLTLAQAFWREGLKLLLAHGESLLETRMYTSLAGLIEGWSKNLYLGSRASFPEEPLLRRLTPWGIVMTAVFWLLPPAWLLLTTIGLIPGPLGPAALATGMSVVFWVSVSMGAGIPPWYGLLYPLGVVMLLSIFARSMARGSGAVEWRGRVYSGVEGARS